MCERACARMHELGEAVQGSASTVPGFRVQTDVQTVETGYRPLHRPLRKRMRSVQTVGISKRRFLSTPSRTVSTVSGFGVRFLNGLYSGLYLGLYGLYSGLYVLHTSLFSQRSVTQCVCVLSGDFAV